MLINLIKDYLHPATDFNFDTPRHKVILNNYTSWGKLVFVTSPQELIRCPLTSTSSQLLKQTELMYTIILPTFDGRSVAGLYFRSCNPANRFHYHLNDNHKLYMFAPYNDPAFQDKTFDQPLILTEGIFDALAIHKFYPYVMSYMGSFPSEVRLHFIATISKYSFLLFDTDEHAQDNIIRLMNKTSLARRFILSSGLTYKDPMSCLENFDGSYLERFVTNLIA